MLELCAPPSAGNWGGNSSGQTNNGTNNTQQWNNTAQRPPTSQADSEFLACFLLLCELLLHWKLTFKLFLVISIFM